jgi:hypothetical protein
MTAVTVPGPFTSEPYTVTDHVCSNPVQVRVPVKPLALIGLPLADVWWVVAEMVAVEPASQVKVPVTTAELGPVRVTAGSAVIVGLAA